MKITVIGTGYVGLVTGACLADSGNDVICVDVDPAKIEMLKKGEIPIYEDGLEKLVKLNAEAGRLHFTTDAAEGIKSAKVIFIAVGTPSSYDGSADLKYVIQVSQTIAEHINDYKVVICKSTVPIGTCDKVRDTIAAQTDIEFDVVSNPEFLKEGSAVKDFQFPDRIIIGAASEKAADIVSDIYAPFQRRANRICVMDVRSAEMTKYASNAMLATKISFMNEIANLCERVGANIENVRTGMSLDERIGPHFIYPGVGYGGSCFPKDVRALNKLGEVNAFPTKILSAVNDVNEKQKLRLFERAEEKMGDLKGKKFAVWGLAFKPRTDDVREAPSLDTIPKLLEAGASVIANDPVATENAIKELPDSASLQFSEDMYAPLEDADALFIFTEWSQYRSPDFDRIKSLMNTPTIFDGRNLYDPEKMAEKGFDYISIGRPTIPKK